MRRGNAMGEVFGIALGCSLLGSMVGSRARWNRAQNNLEIKQEGVLEGRR